MEEETFRFDEDDTNMNMKERDFEYSFGNEDDIYSEDKFQNQSDFEVANDVRTLDSQENEEANKENENITLSSIELLNTEFNEKKDPMNSVSENVSHETKVVEATKMKENNEDHQKGRAKLVRLQAVCSQPSDETAASKLNCTASENVKNKIYISESLDIITDQPIISPEKPNEMLTTSSKENPAFVTPQIQSGVQNIKTSDLLQTAMNSVSENPNTALQQIMFKVQAPNYTIIGQDKISDCSVTKNSSWLTTSSSNNDSSDSQPSSNLLYQTSSSITTEESSGFHNIGNVSDISVVQPMQHFVTTDNKVVYGYKDATGEFHFFSPSMSDRENHNEKKRKRRSRVSDACDALRRMIPGINEKTDKATVFEQTVKYLKFLRDKFENQLDQNKKEVFMLKADLKELLKEYNEKIEKATEELNLVVKLKLQNLEDDLFRGLQELEKECMDQARKTSEEVEKKIIHLRDEIQADIEQTQIEFIKKKFKKPSY